MPSVSETPELSIKQRLKASGATQKELADFLGVTYWTAHRIANERRVNLTDEEKRAVEEFLDLRETPARRGDAVSHSPTASAAVSASLPLFGAIQTAKGAAISLAASGQVATIPPLAGLLHARQAFAVEIVDSTMAPRYEIGEIAYVAAGQMPKRGQDCLVEFADQTGRVLQFAGRDDGGYTFRQLSPPKQITKTAADAVRIHAIVGRG